MRWTCHRCKNISKAIIRRVIAASLGCALSDDKFKNKNTNEDSPYDGTAETTQRVQEQQVVVHSRLPEQRLSNKSIKAELICVVLVTVAAATAVTACITITIMLSWKRKKLVCVSTPKLRHAIISRYIVGLHSTDWTRLITFGTASDSKVYSNFTRRTIFDVLRNFEEQRSDVNNGSPYCTEKKRRGRRPHLRSIDIIGLVLCFLKTKDPVYRLCPVFGIVPSTASVWLDYVLEVFSTIIRKKVTR